MEHRQPVVHFRGLCDCGPQGIVGNARLSEWYLALARDLDVMEPRTPEDVYKLHLAEGRPPAGPAVDSARQNMSSSLVNGLVNAGFGQASNHTFSSFVGP